MNGKRTRLPVAGQVSFKVLKLQSTRKSLTSLQTQLGLTKTLCKNTDTMDTNNDNLVSQLKVTLHQNGKSF